MTESAVVLSGAGGELTATFLPAAGMICASLRHGGDELLAQRRGLGAYLEHGSTFALPLLYPWANRLSGWEYEFDATHVVLDPADALIHRDAAHGVPMHGVLAGASDWRVNAATEQEVRAELDFGAHAKRLAAFPFPHRLEYVAELTDVALTITLTVTPSGGVVVPVSFGFHPYLAIGGARQAWELSGPVPGLEGPLVDRSFDDSHAGMAGARFSVYSDRRELGVDFLTGYSEVQIFAPENSDFICFEPMTAPTDALRSGVGLIRVEPGQAFSASFAITVSS